MKTLQIALVFALVLQSFGQDFYSRRRRPIKKPQDPVNPNGGKHKTVSTDPFQPKPVVKSSVLLTPVKTAAVQPDLGMGSPGFNGANIPLSELPQWVRDLEGRIMSGTALGLPESGHGGLGAGGDYSSGLRDGWGADPNVPMPRSLREWINPGAAATGPGAVAHTAVKANAEHNLVKEATHLVDKTVGSGTVSHDLAKTDIHVSQKAGLGPGIDAVGQAVATRMAHASVKSGGVAGMGRFGVDPIGHNIGKSAGAIASVDTVATAAGNSQFDRPRVDSFVRDASVGGFIPGGSVQIDLLGTAGRVPFGIPNSAGLGVDSLGSVGSAFIDVNPANSFGILGDRFRARGSMVQGIGAVPGMIGGRSFANLGGFDIYGNRRTG